ncbi:hypothetical protein Tco_0987910 [Tanacetum coccineum]
MPKNSDPNKPNLEEKSKKIIKEFKNNLSRPGAFLSLEQKLQRQIIPLPLTGKETASGFRQYDKQRKQSRRRNRGKKQKTRKGTYQARLSKATMQSTKAQRKHKYTGAGKARTSRKTRKANIRQR